MSDGPNLLCLHMLVEMSGFEPPTPCVQGRCSPAELHPHADCGLRNVEFVIKFRNPHSKFRNWLVGLDRFELSTSRLSGVRSNQLSYRPSVWRMAYSFF